MSPDVLRQLLRYDPERGELRWRERDADMFRFHRNPHLRSKWFNHRWADRPLPVVEESRRLKTRLIGVEGYKALFPTAELIWVLVTGSWPRKGRTAVSIDGKFTPESIMRVSPWWLHLKRNPDQGLATRQNRYGLTTWSCRITLDEGDGTVRAVIRRGIPSREEAQQRLLELLIQNGMWEETPLTSIREVHDDPCSA